jgi:hypothetical protein
MHAQPMMSCMGTRKHTTAPYQILSLGPISSPVGRPAAPPTWRMTEKVWLTWLWLASSALIARMRSRIVASLGRRQ